MSVQVSGSTTIAAPRERVHRVVLAIEDYPQWAGGIRSAVVDERDADGRPVLATVAVQTPLAQVTCTLAYEHTSDGLRWSLVRGEILNQFDGAYRLADDPAGTAVTCSMEVGVDLPLPRPMLEKAVNDLLEKALGGLRARAQDLTD